MKRNKRISIYFTEEEKERIKIIARNESGLSMSSFIRRIVFLNTKQRELQTKGVIIEENQII